MANKRALGNIRDLISDVVSAAEDTQKFEITQETSLAARSLAAPHRAKGAEMIRDLALAGGDASQRSGEGGKCGGGMGGQKAGGIKGGGKRKTHVGRK